MLTVVYIFVLQTPAFLLHKQKLLILVKNGKDTSCKVLNLSKRIITNTKKYSVFTLSPRKEKQMRKVTLVLGLVFCRGGLCQLLAADAISLIVR
jgi:hypothetical protein